MLSNLSNRTASVIVVFKEEHVHELNSGQEDSLLIIILASEVDVVLVSHGEAFVNNTEMFLLELTDFAISSGTSDNFEV